MSHEPFGTVRVVSFGFKYGDPPPEANIVLDVRCLPNPFHVPHLRPLTGKDAAVQDYIRSHPMTGPVVQAFKVLFETMLDGYLKNAANYTNQVTIAFGCTGGKHRSQFMVCTMAKFIGELLDGRGIRHAVEMFHRDDGKE